MATLEEQFADPMKGFETIIAESSVDVDDALDSIENRLTAKQDDWSVRYKALKEAMAYLNGQIDQYSNANYAKLAPGIALCITDLRSALVKMGALLVTACAVVWKSDYVSSLDIIVPALFKQLSHGTAVIANSCRLALIAIATNVQHRRTCRIFLANKKSKNAMHRLVVAEALSIIRSTWPTQLMESLKSEVADALVDLSNDASADVRKTAKDAMSIVPTPSNLMPRNRPSTPTTVKRNLTPGRRSRTPILRNSGRTARAPHESIENIAPNTEVVEKRVSFKKQEDTDISQYMPPQTKDQANSFVRILKQLSDKNDSEPLTGLEEFLPEAIISSVRFVPAESTVWKPLMAFVFRNYASEFTPKLRDLVVAFEVSSWLMDMVVKVFPAQTLLFQFGKCRRIDDEDAYLLFTGLFSRCLDVEIDTGLRRFLKDLAKANENEDDVCLIENALEVSKPKEDLLPSLVERVKQGGSWLGKSRKLTIALSKGFDPDLTAKVQSHLIKEFSEVLKNGTTEEMANVREFLTHVSGELKYITFVDLTPLLIPPLLGDNLSEKEKTEQCFMALMNDEKVLQRLIRMLGEENSQDFYHAILNVVYMYAQRCSLNQLTSMIRPFMQCAVGFLTSATIAIRRLTVMILVEFKCRAPKDFTPFLQDFTSSQQKLISLYSSKRCQ